ncbi:MAG: hypothetical protein FWH16_00690 [Oscillospiraceae bacterium]|nr:hypothetical protein [Oscillospiraceae bacterium]
MEKKVFGINAGKVLLLRDDPEAFAGYDGVEINAGKVIASRKMYERLQGMGAAINCGVVKVLDIKGEVAELDGNTVITGAEDYSGRFVVCDGNLVVESAEGLRGAEGIYAGTLFYPESADLSGVRNISADNRVAYPDGAKLRLEGLELGGDAHIVLEGGALYWVHGRIKALDGGALEKLDGKGTTFKCGTLIIYAGLYERFREMFKADRYEFIPDGYGVADGDLSLDAGTAALYGDRLVINGDLTVAHDQAGHLKAFKALKVNGAVTMPVSAAADFKAVGSAEEFELYEGVLLNVNGFQTIGSGQLRTAAAAGGKYTIKVNGALYFDSAVTAEDMEAIAAVHCNGIISAPDAARGGLDGKVRELNGMILDADAMLKKAYGEDFSADPIGAMKKIKEMAGVVAGSGVNAGKYRN